MKINLGKRLYYVYVLQSLKDKNLYVGYTRDLIGRLKDHNEGKSSATSARKPLKVIYYEGCLSITDATRRERYLKTAWGKRYIKNRLKNYLRRSQLDS